MKSIFQGRNPQIVNAVYIVLKHGSIEVLLTNIEHFHGWFKNLICDVLAETVFLLVSLSTALLILRSIRKVKIHHEYKS